MSKRAWLRLLAITFPIVVAALGLAAYLRLAVTPSQVPIALALVETTTLSVLSGQVQIKPAAAQSWLPAINGQTLTVGDAVKTLASSHALITYFEGSTTEIDPDTELAITKLNKDPGGYQYRDLYQPPRW